MVYKNFQSYLVFITKICLVIIFGHRTCGDYVHIDLKAVGSENEPMLFSYQCDPDSNWTLKPFEPLRLKWFLVDMDMFTPARLEVVEMLLNETINSFYKLLRVRRSSFPLSPGQYDLHDCEADHKYHPIEGDRCSGIGILDADYIVYVHQFTCSDTTLAVARHCGSTSFDERPIFGSIGLCVNSTNMEKWNWHALLMTLQHELMHAMGFTGYGLHIIKYYNDGHRIDGLQSVYRLWQVHKWHKRLYESVLVTTPKVKDFVRKHFNCSSLEGAELENEGEGGTRRVHWEKRIFGPEMMTGFISRRSYFSRLTLSYLEDTGWFEANYSFAHKLIFGKNKGCIFAKQSCREYMDSLNASVRSAAYPYCNWEDLVEKQLRFSTVRECSDDLTYYTHCDWYESNISTVDRDKQYFYDKWVMVGKRNISGQWWYGKGDAADGCPQWSPYYYANESKDNSKEKPNKVGDSICQNQYSQPPAHGNLGAELFGDDSICMKQDGKFEVFSCWPFGITLYDTEGGHGAGCYKYKCERNRLMIQANFLQDDNPKYLFQRQWKVCWGKGSVVHIRRHQASGMFITGEYGRLRYHKGLIICHDCKMLCENNTRWENGNFRCASDIHLNSTDFSDLPCPQEIGSAEKRLMHKGYIFLTIVLILRLSQ